MSQLPDFEAWAIFAKTVELRSFTAAAEALGLSKATVSKAVTRLEQSLGVALLHRSSRTLALTESGRALLPRAEQLLSLGEEADNAAREEAGSPSGLVRLAAPMTFGISHVGPALPDFHAHYPDIAIDLHLSDDIVDIVAGGFDLALRIAALPDSALRARRIGPVARYLVAAPSYLERHCTPRHPSELSDHDCLCYAYLPNPESWRFVGPEGEEVAIRPRGPLRCNNADAMMPALRAGLGIALVPDFVGDAEIECGALVKLLADWAPPPVALNIVTPAGGPRPARVTALIEFFGERFSHLCAARSTVAR